MCNIKEYFMQVFTLELSITVRYTKYDLHLLNLGQIGGQLGLFVGVSILTLLEVIEAFVLACTKKKEKMKTVPYPEWE